MIILLFILWYIIGGSSFVFWWTKEFDLTVSELWAPILLGLFGPITFLIGWIVHGNKSTKVLIKKRNKDD